MEKQKTRLYYYKYTPRGFANEYDILSVDQSNEQEKAILDDLRNYSLETPNVGLIRISRKQAYRLTAKNRSAYKKGEANYQNPAGATEIESISLFD